MITLRPYQQDARRAIYHEWRSGLRSTLLVLPTGGGKTVLFSGIAADVVSKGHRVLCLAHRRELIEQGANCLINGFGLSVSVEQAEERAQPFSQVVFANVATMRQPKRLAKFRPDEFALVICDEAHHSTAKSWRAVINHFPAARVLGVTATPTRLDKVGLHNIFESVAYQVTIADGIEQGWLCPIRAESVQVEGLDLDSLRIEKGDFAEDEIQRLLQTEEVLRSMVVPTVERAGQRPTIIFTSSVSHALSIKDALCRVIGSEAAAVAVSGDMPVDRREDAINRFKTGKAQFVANVGVLTEGFDHPPTSCIALYRPTKSIGLLAQMVGRATRNAEGKTDALILDFVGAHQRVETMNVMNVLDGDDLPSDMKRRAREIAEKEGVDALTALQRAKQEAANLKRLQAQMKFNYQTHAVELLGLFGLPKNTGRWGLQPATDKQVATLRKLGVQEVEGLQFQQATRLLQQLFDRKDKGLCTLKQARMLTRLGYNGDAWQVSFQDASRLIDQYMTTAAFA